MLKRKTRDETGGHVVSQTSTYQSLSLIGSDNGDLVRLLDGTVGGGRRDAMDDFVRRRRTFGASELNVKYVGNFGDKRQPARQFPSDFLWLFPETLRLSLLRNVVHGTRILHGCRCGGARSRWRGKLTRMPHKLTRSHMHNVNPRWSNNDCERTSETKYARDPVKIKNGTDDRRQAQRRTRADPRRTTVDSPQSTHMTRRRRRRCSAAPFDASSETGPSLSVRARILIIILFFILS